MNRFKPATVTIPDFLLISGEGGDSCYQTTKAILLGKWSEAFGYDHFGDSEVFELCPTDRILNVVTEDLAKEWWKLYGEPNAEVPAIFAKHLVDEVEAIASPRRSERDPDLARDDRINDEFHARDSAVAA